ncbi:MAG TPA: DUF1223 domain-containing protein [Puia sp.]|jgi:hypothetical protein|nr:DUF1223 domain-containing protein [Puia sp.]
MKNLRRIAVLAFCLIITFLAARAFLRSAPSSVLTGPSKGFAVVELFTSEGCSSCPPADQLVARIQQEAKDQPVYILAFHVDYWDRQGWKDAFSDPRYTQRQNRYASWLNLQSVYTPQIVVNGRKEFVGSQENTLRSAINSSLEQTPAARLTISDVRMDQGKISWHYQVQNAVANSSLIVAIVQRSATTDVKAGENSGRTLSHVQIVRNFSNTAVGTGASGAGSLPVGQGMASGDEELIAFVQYDDNGQIVAATRAPVP